MHNVYLCTFSKMNACLLCNLSGETDSPDGGRGGTPDEDVAADGGVKQERNRYNPARVSAMNKGKPSRF